MTTDAHQDLAIPPHEKARALLRRLRRELETVERARASIRTLHAEGVYQPNGAAEVVLLINRGAPDEVRLDDILVSERLWVLLEEARKALDGHAELLRFHVTGLTRRLDARERGLN